MLSPLTAKTHVARLFTKLDARDRAQLVVIITGRRAEVAAVDADRRNTPAYERARALVARCAGPCRGRGRVQDHDFH